MFKDFFNNLFRSLRVSFSQMRKSVGEVKDNVEKESEDLKGHSWKDLPLEGYIFVIIGLLGLIFLFLFYYKVIGY